MQSKETYYGELEGGKEGVLGQMGIGMFTKGERRIGYKKFKYF